MERTIVHAELDKDLLEKINQESAKDLFSRKAQIFYIIMKQH